MKYIPSIKLPTVKIKLNFNFLPVVVKYLLGILTVLLVLTGSLGLFISYINPMKWIAPFLPMRIENILWTGAWVNITETLVLDMLVYIQVNLIWTVSISISLILIGFLIHLRDFKIWWKNLRAAPMGVVRSPIRAYRRITVWRNWILDKIEYLNAESARWKTAFNIAKSPYSLLRALGFSPQMAIGLLAVGSTAGSAVAVN